MVHDGSISKIAFLGDYVPRKCGIATFTKDLFDSIHAEFPEKRCIVVPVNDIEGGYDYPPEVRFEIDEPDLSSYLRAADFINLSDTDILSVQHEYGIYGGQSGAHVLSILREANIPVVTTVHTVLQEPSPDQRRVMIELTRASTRVVTMAEKGRSILEETYRVPPEKIEVIPHGIPDMPFADPNYYKDEFNVLGKQVLLTFGLIAPNKGIEFALRALPEISRSFPDIVYIVVGQTHPNLIRAEGERYRMQLKQLAKDLGVRSHVVFIDRFVGLEELQRFIGAADIYLTPYLSEAQITSGALAYAFGSGNAVVSTPYWHAKELLSDGKGVIVPFRDPAGIAQAVTGLLSDDGARHAMRKRAYQLGRDMTWSSVARRYMETFARAEADYGKSGRGYSPIKTLEKQPMELPDLRLDHLSRLSDTVGIFQHAAFTVPKLSEGYCADDNARALLLALKLQCAGQDSPRVSALASSYLAFISNAFDAESGRFRNFLGFDRTWAPGPGSEDCHAHALWALGYCIRCSDREGFRLLAADLFEKALPAVQEFTSPRAWATVLLGLDEYLARLGGDRRAGSIRDSLVSRLQGLYEACSSEGWLWFEDGLAYANARIPHALIATGHSTGNARALETGLRSLSWLMGEQTSSQGAFSPIGTNGFYRRGGERARFDQQPIEAQASISACASAYDATEDPRWIKLARTAFEWFLGRNDIGLPLYDSETGGCHDGLHIDRVNQNEGCESTLAFLLSLVEMQSLQNADASG